MSTSKMFHCNAKMAGTKKHTPSNDIIVTKWPLLGITSLLLWMRLFEQNGAISRASVGSIALEHIV